MLNGGYGRAPLASSSRIRSRIGDEDPLFFHHYLYIYLSSLLNKTVKEKK